MRSATRGRVRIAALVLAVALGGALLGLVGGVATPAHVEIAGSDTRVWLRPGQPVDEAGVTGLVTLRRATSRAVVGEPVGVRVVADVDLSAFVSDGRINTDLLPAYVGVYSDPEQLVSDITWAVVRHLLRWTISGAVLALLLLAAIAGHRRWRRRHDRRTDPTGRARAVALAYHEPERRWLRRTALALPIVLVLAAVPSAVADTRPSDRVRPTPALAGTPLASIEVTGLLRPAIVAVRDYVERYFAETDDYYSELRTRLLARLDADPVTLPGRTGPTPPTSTDAPLPGTSTPSGDAGDDIAYLGFVTDRHCNTGMDRVTVALLHRLGVTTLVDAGDDAFSGTFGFETACTRNLALQSDRAGITDVVAGGNHDSPAIIAAEADQGMKTLTGDVVEVDGLRFTGRPDPRTSRYGQGIRPASAAAQQQVLTGQGRAIGKDACAAQRPVVVVAHDPSAGTRALENGCGHAVLALDGHTHQQDGPLAVPLPDGTTGVRFTGGSAGGAPSPEVTDRSFTSSVTVGPLQHDAVVYVLGVDRTTGALVGGLAFRFTPAQDVSVTTLPTAGT